MANPGNHRPPASTPVASVNRDAHNCPQWRKCPKRRSRAERGCADNAPTDTPRVPFGVSVGMGSGRGAERAGRRDGWGCGQPHPPFPACFQVTHPKIFLSWRFSDQWSSCFPPCFHCWLHATMPVCRVAHSGHHQCRNDRGFDGVSGLHAPARHSTGLQAAFHAESEQVYRIRAYRPSEGRFFDAGSRVVQPPPHPASALDGWVRRWTDG